MRARTRFTAITVILVMIVFSLSTLTAFADETGITIRIDGNKTFSNVNSGSELVVPGIVDPSESNIEILSVDGNALVNVGTKSGVLDSQGRTVLEFNSIEIGDGIWQLRFNYHAGDDPVVANQGLAFEIVNVIIKSSEDAVVDPTPTVTCKTTVKSIKMTTTKRTIKASWKTSSAKCTGYKVQWSTDKAFKKGTKTKYVSKKAYTISKLKSGKKYYVKVTPYKSYKDTLGNSKKAFGKAMTKSIKVK